jgi:uncharacterized protein
MKLPPIELLEAVHKFPGPFTFKIIADNNDKTHQVILEALQNTLSLAEKPSHTSRQSESGKHASLTVELQLNKAQDVHLIYEVLLKTPGVLLLL